MNEAKELNNLLKKKSPKDLSCAKERTPKSNVKILKIVFIRYNL